MMLKIQIEFQQNFCGKFLPVLKNHQKLKQKKNVETLVFKTVYSTLKSCCSVNVAIQGADNVINTMFLKRYANNVGRLLHVSTLDKRLCSPLNKRLKNVLNDRICNVCHKRRINGIQNRLINVQKLMFDKRLIYNVYSTLTNKC